MNVPTHLSHKPIIGVNDYDRIDGQFTPNTDAQALSIGQAQYDEREISVKVFRHTGNKWSPQSEELPPHRALDLTILIITSMLTNPITNSVISHLNEQIVEPRRVQEITAYYNANRQVIRSKLEEIRDLLNTLL
jgi:hypothetical protein